LFNKKHLSTLERIADALERIADRMEYGDPLAAAPPAEKAAPVFTQISPAAQQTTSAPQLIIPPPAAAPQFTPESSFMSHSFGEHFDKIADYLSRHGLNVTKALSEEPDTPYRFGKEAWYIGGKYDSLAFLLRHLRRIAATGESSILDVSFAEQEQLVYITQFCYILQGSGILSAYSYDRPNRRITVAVDENNTDGLDFLSGSWLPHYIYSAAKRAASTEYRTHNVPIRRYVFARDAQVVSARDAERYTLGMLAHFCGKTFWVECVSRFSADAVQKYGSFAKKYGFPHERTFLVVQEGDAETLGGWEKIYGNLQLCTAETFSERFSAALKQTIFDAGGTINNSAEY
jgi:hypothetical protein